MGDAVENIKHEDAQQTARVKIVRRIVVVTQEAKTVLDVGGVFVVHRDDALAFVRSGDAVPVDGEPFLVDAVPVVVAPTKQRIASSTPPPVVIAEGVARRLSTRDGEHVLPARSALTEE